LMERTASRGGGGGGWWGGWGGGEKKSPPLLSLKKKHKGRKRGYLENGGQKRKVAKPYSLEQGGAEKYAILRECFPPGELQRKILIVLKFSGQKSNSKG